MFSFIKQNLEKVYTTFATKARALFGTAPDEQTLKQLETLLLEADTGVPTTKLIMQRLRTRWDNGTITDGTQLQKALEHELITILGTPTDDHATQVYLLVGINGSGKTTCASKLAHRLTHQGKKVLLVAADTFRAAAVEQLTTWAQRVGVDVVTGTANQDPAAVVFSGCQRYKDQSYDVLIIDTAGRLQTKVNLMNELEKIGRVIKRQLPDARSTTLLVVDAMLGQNSLDQARLFNECVKLDGIVLSKMDGTGKGGIVFAIRNELQVPIAYLSCGEQVDTLLPFEPASFITSLLTQPN